MLTNSLEFHRGRPYSGGLRSLAGKCGREGLGRARASFSRHSWQRNKDLVGKAVEQRSPPTFDDAFTSELEQLFEWRRDVRSFKEDPIDPKIMEKLFYHAMLAPSVGNSQPWRFVVVNDPEKRAKIVDNFKRANKDALEAYEGERKKSYAQLKLGGLEKAPVHLAVFCDPDPKTGHGLGRRTMPEALQYSCIAAIQQLALSARALNIGVGWFTIVFPEEFNDILEVPSEWNLVTHLAIGYPDEDDVEPYLEKVGWQERLQNSEFILNR